MDQSAQLMPVGQLLRTTWDLVKSRWKTVLAIQLIAALALFTFIVAAALLGFATTLLMPLLVVPIIFIAGLAVLWGIGWTQAAQIRAVDGGPEVNFSKAFQSARPQALGLIAVSLVVGLIVLFGLILLIIPGIVFAVWFSQSVYVYVLENTGLTESLRKSKQLVSGRFWSVLLRYVVIFVPAMLISLLIGVLFPDGQGAQLSTDYSYVADNTNPLGNLLDFIFSMALGIFTIVYSLVLYRDLSNTQGSQSSSETASAA